MSQLFTPRRSRTSPALHYVEGPPNGPTLLLLHGVARNGTDWQNLLPELVKEWHVVALDHRGHGESERVATGDYLVLDYVRDAAAFVREHCGDPVTVFGHSLGAMVALGVAAECADVVNGVVLEDPPFELMGRDIGATPYQAQFAGMREVARLGMFDLEELTDILGEVELPFPTGPKRLAELRDRDSLRYSAGCLQHVDPEVFTPIVAGRWLEGFDHAALWPRVASPALLLQGDLACGACFRDVDVSLAKSLLKNCRHIYFPGVGHQIHRTRPTEVLAALRELIA